MGGSPKHCKCCRSLLYFFHLNIFQNCQLDSVNKQAKKEKKMLQEKEQASFGLCDKHYIRMQARCIFLIRRVTARRHLYYSGLAG